ncbi:alpha/beta hydrolase [Streptomyces minutiscleroticus]|uniref:alpha/beta hydrolase n=1 Tax=Streptomyces minutiscleroticus TaxID=68238 RepID=UPI001E479DF6|nr:alpha/beta hydrolase [Streptomyces minutiscleroticus]
MLFSPGAATSRRLGFGADALGGLGVRLISLDRPGPGVSAPSPARSFPAFAEDVQIFAELRGPGRPMMAAHSRGAPFALACAAASVVGGPAVVPGADEVSDARFAGVLPGEPQRPVDLAVTGPGAAERMFARLTADRMRDLVMPAGPETDPAVHRHPVFAAACRHALGEAFAQGAGGYARDTVLAMGHRGIDLSSVRVPVHPWYGASDVSHSPDPGAGPADRIPSSVRHVVPDTGGALLWTHYRDVLRTLLRGSVTWAAVGRAEAGRLAVRSCPPPCALRRRAGALPSCAGRNSGSPHPDRSYSRRAIRC